MRISDSELNRLQVLKAIRRAEPVARTDLVKLTGLATGTISQLTAEFVRRGVLVEEKASGRTLGRPRIELRLNADAGYVLSVSHQLENSASIEIVNLRGDPVFAYTAPLERDDTLEMRARHMARIINDAVAASGVAKARIFRVGVVIHGMVDNVKGVIRWQATYPEGEVPFAALIEDHVQIPVVIDNDTNVLARAEHWFGQERQIDDFGLIVIDGALTSAYYAGGMPWNGVNGVNPELGHTKIGGGDPRPCYCGMSGCLATYCAIFGVVGRICERRGIVPAPDPLVGWEMFRCFAAEALAGDAVAKEVFELSGRMLGMAVANMLNDRDPGRIIVMTFEPDMQALISEAFHAALAANTLPPVLERADVAFRTVDRDHYRKGCAALALEEIYRG